jgi:RNA polymerase sigma factor (TIGR02999 family)
MSEVTRLLDAAASGDRKAAADLLPLVYDELRQLAAVRMAAEAPDQTLQPTALVHEAYLRLVGPADGAKWDHRGHFFAAAAEAMRRILVDHARRKAADRHGGGRARIDLDPDLAPARETREDLIALDEALDRLAAQDPIKAELVKLRYFAGLTLPEAAAALGLSERTAGRQWAFARAWLRREVEGTGDKS